MEPLERSAIENLKAHHDVDDIPIGKGVSQGWGWLVGLLLLILAGVVISVSFTMYPPSNLQTDNQSP